ncbi:MAG: CPBP family intramembrane metalloprotease [Bacteroidales bacterium]|nr:CPBP family intramembrane metalloprotease [Bacteroidales bacterium]
MFKQFQSFKQVGTCGKLVSLLIITLVCLLLAFLAGGIEVVLFSIFSGIDYTQVSADTNFIRIYQILTTLIIFVIPAIVCAQLFDGSIKQGLYLNQKPDSKTLIISLSAMLAAIPLSSCLADWNSHLSLPSFMSDIEEWMRAKEEHAKVLTDKMLITDNFGIYLFNIIVLAVIPAVGEELYFRATLQKMLTGKRPILAAFVAAVLFSAIHMQFYGFVPRLLLGFMLGFMLVCTKNILVPIAAHFFNNFCVVTMYYATGSDVQLSDNMSIMWYLAIGVSSAAVTAMLLRYMYKKHVKKLTQ